MTTQKITVEEAAPILGMSPNKIRYYMRAKRFDPPIGQIRRSLTGKTYRYDIYKAKVMAYVGIAEWPEGGEEK